MNLKKILEQFFAVFQQKKPLLHLHLLLIFLKNRFVEEYLYLDKSMLINYDKFARLDKSIPVSL